MNSLDFDRKRKSNFVTFPKMKIFIRGGIWSNVEDQVLLAAYMKYGNNQWTRIASLLPKKSPAQVKARWEEYLDPTLKKTPWTHADDEKLLHLARFMPMQWRTISQYFNRSPYQCIERYRELIDKATNTPYIDDNESAIQHQMMPNFETLKATPDGEEFDQDEREMLEEARARLANTQGKKARRKARERQLNVLRKIAKMRKKRELDAAGLVIEEKRLWEDEEIEIDPFRTHKPFSVKFNTDKDDKALKDNRLIRIKSKQKAVKKNLESLDHLKQELKNEEKKLETPIDHRRTDLVLPQPTISDSELKLIEELRHHNSEYLQSRSSLSLFNGMQKQQQNKFDFSIEEKIEKEEVEYKTPVYEKSLPRPIPLKSDYLETVGRVEDLADSLIREEAFKLALMDARKHPDTRRPPPTLVVPINDAIETNFLTDDKSMAISPDSLYEAERMINDEVSSVVRPYSDEEFANEWEKQHPEEEDNVEEPLNSLSSKVTKMRQILDQRSKSFLASSENLVTEINQRSSRISNLLRNKDLYLSIAEIEEKTLQPRIDVIKHSIEDLEKKQMELNNEIGRRMMEIKAEAKKAKRIQKE